MKHIGILILTFVIFTNCNSQVKDFVTTGITDQTEQLVKNKTGWTSLKDKQRIDGYTRIGDSIFGGEIACNVKPLKDIDIRSFKVYPGTKYAKDDNHVYFPININCVDYEDCGVCYYDKIIIGGANPLTFKYLSKDYAIDGENVYFRGHLIKDADGKTFNIVEGPEYFYFATDKNHVYMHDKIFKNADPSTFYYDKRDIRNNLSGGDVKYIIGDKDNEWEYGLPDEIKKIDKK